MALITVAVPIAAYRGRRRVAKLAEGIKALALNAVNRREYFPSVVQDLACRRSCSRSSGGRSSLENDRLLAFYENIGSSHLISGRAAGQPDYWSYGHRPS